MRNTSPLSLKQDTRRTDLLPAGANVSAQAPSNATSTAYASSLVVKTGPGQLYGCTGYNSGPAQWVQFYNSTTLPANAVAPTGPVFNVAAASSFAIDFGLRGRSFATGIVVGNSTTGPTKTIGAADCFFDVQYS